MENDWAAQNLQTIRTLMERSAVYRRALAPIMIAIGLLGIAAAFIGWKLELNSDRQFTIYWLSIGLAGTVLGFVLARRQALKDSEPFWTPPVRRIVTAVAPAWCFGLFVSSFFTISSDEGEGSILLPAIWMACYGISLHAAGFFMPRGIKVFGWLFIFLSCDVFILMINHEPSMSTLWNNHEIRGHLLMGPIFGGLHLLYGIYLYFTERKTAA